MTSATRRILFALLTVLASLALLELASFALVSIRSRGIWSASTHFKNGFPEFAASEEGCSWGDQVGLHPYLAFTYHHRARCQHLGINSLGRVGAELPERKPSDRFTILLLGGSVAEQLYASQALEKTLNERYVGPQGRRFLVLNGAIAAGQQPMQVMTFMKLQDLADGVVSLEGYNERFNYANGHPLENPPRIWSELASRSIQGPSLAGALRGIGPSLYRFCSRNRVLSHSYTAFLLTQSLARLAVAVHDPSNTPEFEARRPLSAAREKYVADYRKWLGTIHILARERGIRDLFFIQPAPALEHRLSASDLKVVGDLSYGPQYRELTDALLGLRKSAGLPVASLIGVFKDYSGDLYSDPIHFRGDRPGNTKLAEAMALIIAAEWGLDERP